MNKAVEEAKPAMDRTFLNVLENHRQGDFVSDISAALKQCTAAVQLTGKGGCVTLKMNLKPATVGNAIVFEPMVKTTIPETKPAGSIFYADDDFNLVRDDPQQKKLDLREVQPSKGSESLREVEAK
jgi:hypothetical protein